MKRTFTELESKQVASVTQKETSPPPLFTFNKYFFPKCHPSDTQSTSSFASISIPSSNNNVAAQYKGNIITIRQCMREDYGLYIWPSSVVLAAYLYKNSKKFVKDKTILELGCGTALPGLLCAKLNAKHVILTDHFSTSTYSPNPTHSSATPLNPLPSNSPTTSFMNGTSTANSPQLVENHGNYMLENLKQECILNGISFSEVSNGENISNDAVQSNNSYMISTTEYGTSSFFSSPSPPTSQEHPSNNERNSSSPHYHSSPINSANRMADDRSSKVTIFELSWGRFNESLLKMQKNVDYIIAADCFYEPKYFPDFLATVAYILKNKNASDNVELITTYHERSETRNIQCILENWGLSATQVPLSSFLDSETFKAMHSLDDNMKEEENIVQNYFRIIDSVTLFHIKLKTSQ